MKSALIYAINNYGGINQLKDSLNDAEDLRSTLVSLGFNVDVKLDVLATRVNMLAGMRNILNNAVAGDSIVIAFFGHGSWFYGPYGKAQCICPIDVFQKGLIADYEIENIFNTKKAGVTLDFINGACYSGTSSRRLSEPRSETFSDFQVHYIKGPLNASNETMRVSRSMPVVVNINHVAWNACGKDEVSWGGISGGKYRGIFPLYLCWAFRNMRTSTRAQIDAYVSSKVSAIKSTQHPQIEGTITELGQLPFT